MGKNKRRSKNNNSTNTGSLVEPVNKNPLIDVSQSLSEEMVCSSAKGGTMEDLLKRILNMEQRYDALYTRYENLQKEVEANNYLLLHDSSEFEHELIPPPEEFLDNDHELELSSPSSEVSGAAMSTNTSSVQEDADECNATTISEVIPKRVEKRYVFAENAEVNYSILYDIDQQFVEFYMMNLLYDLKILEPRHSSELEKFYTSVKQIRDFYLEGAQDFFPKVDEIHDIYGDEAKSYPDIKQYLPEVTGCNAGSHSYTKRLLEIYSTAEHEAMLARCDSKVKHSLFKEDPIPVVGILNRFLSNEKLLGSLDSDEEMVDCDDSQSFDY